LKKGFVVKNKNRESPALNQLKFIVPCIFAKLTRVVVKNVNPLETSIVKIWCQAQE